MKWNESTVIVYAAFQLNVSRNVDGIALELNMAPPKVRVECSRMAAMGVLMPHVGYADGYALTPTCKQPPWLSVGESADGGILAPDPQEQQRLAEDQWRLQVCTEAAKLLGVPKLGSATMVHLMDRLDTHGVCSTGGWSAVEAAEWWLDLRVQEAADAAESREDV